MAHSGVSDGDIKRKKRRFIGRFLRQRAAVVALVFLLLLIVVAVLAPWIAPHDPSATNAAVRLSGPTAEHWLGTDDLGRDILSRNLYASRVSLYAAFVAVGVALSLSLPVGLAGGFLGGRLDSLVQRVTEAVMAFPSLILAIGVIGVLGPGLTNAMLAIGIAMTPHYVRIIRGATLAVREEVFVEAAHQVGSPRHRTIIGHVVPNIMSPIVVQTTLGLALAILSEAGLSFLGLGVQPPTPSWGNMLSRGFTFMHEAPINVIVPGVTIVLVVLAINIVGDGIHDAVGRETRSAD